MKAFDYAIAHDLPGALELLAQGWAPKAGGIDLLDRLKERIDAPERIVSVAELRSLEGIATATAGGLELGALVTLDALARDPSVLRGYPALAHAAGEAATPQVRAVATVGGNLCQRPRCWYFRSRHHECLKRGDSICSAAFGEHDFHAVFGGGPCHIVHPSNLAPALVAADASLTLERRGGRRELAAERFFVGPRKRLDGENALETGELVTRIKIPQLPERSAYVELRRRRSFDWPLASCVAARLGGRWRVVLGAVAPVPWRAKGAERALAGVDRIDHDLAERAAAAALEGAEPMRDNGWRLELVRAAVRRALLLADGKEIDR